ncbi:hypothetical protein ACLKA7_004386 [Drosophila subpalustris]
MLGMSTSDSKPVQKPATANGPSNKSTRADSNMSATTAAAATTTTITRTERSSMIGIEIGISASASDLVICPFAGHFGHMNGQ